MANSLTHSGLPYPIRNARYSLMATFDSSSTGLPADPTTPDTEVSTDGGASSIDATEEITTGSGNGVGYVTLTGAETNNPSIVAILKSANCYTQRVPLTPRNLATIGSGTLSAGSAGGGTLGTLLAYDVTGCFLRTTGGTGGGGTGGANNQARKIVTYNTTTGAFTVVPNWETTPDATTTYDALLPEGVTLGMLQTINPATPGRTLAVDSTGRVNAFLIGILTSVFTEGATSRIADAFKQFFNIATPTSTMNRITLVDTTTANTDMRGTDGAALAATALSTADWTPTRAGYLDTLNGLVAAIWASATRTLTAFGFTVDTNANATETAAAASAATAATQATAAATQTTAAAIRADMGLASANLDTQMDELLTAVEALDVGSGTGARTVTFTVNDGASPLQNAIVRVIQGAEDYTATTNVSGIAVFALDDFTWAYAVTKPGYDGETGTLVVNGTEALTVSLDAAVITPSEPGLTTLYLQVRDLSPGNSASDITVQLRIDGFSANATGVGISDQYVSGVTDETGYVEFVGVPQGILYSVKVASGEWEQGTAGDGATSAIISTYGVPSASVDCESD